MRQKMVFCLILLSSFIGFNCVQAQELQIIFKPMDIESSVVLAKVYKNFWQKWRIIEEKQNFPEDMEKYRVEIHPISLSNGQEKILFAFIREEIVLIYGFEDVSALMNKERLDCFVEEAAVKVRDFFRELKKRNSAPKEKGPRAPFLYA